MTDKVIVTNETALRTKYGEPGLRAIHEALGRLAAADRGRGLSTRVVAVDRASVMRRLGAPPVGGVMDCRENKNAIDAIWAATTPDYLMLLGAADVVPHQDLRNPVHDAGDDDDVWAFGDLPYACEASYSREIARFVGPTRVVSRLPDLTGARDPGHLVERIDAAAAWRPWQPADVERYFALSAAEWRGSTALSLGNVFGNAAALELAPPDGPAFPAPVIGARAHFINCHGGESDPAFYGQLGRTFPHALTSVTTRGRIVTGTVAAVECCYGAQLYPADALQLPVPICESYLAQGAYGYFGSTTIAYGPADGNGAADLLAQAFLSKVLEGSSLGMAALGARQAFAAQTGQMDPVDLKTLAQFCLYGDPSIHPVRVPSPTTVPKGIQGRHADAMGRRERRATLADSGRRLQREKPTAGSVERRGQVSRRVRSVLRGLSREAGVSPARFVAFAVRRRKRTRSGKPLVHPARYHVLVARSPDSTPPVAARIAIVARELGGRVVAYRVYYSR